MLRCCWPIVAVRTFKLINERLFCSGKRLNKPAPFITVVEQNPFWALEEEGDEEGQLMGHFGGNGSIGGRALFKGATESEDS
jgi:hypothetical protein